MIPLREPDPSFAPDNNIFTTFAPVIRGLMEQNKFINTMLKRPFWILMAVLCIVFSSASKRLIEMKVAPYFTTSQVIGKKIKDGSRDRRDSFKFFKQADKKQADIPSPEILFLSATLLSFAAVFLSGIYFRKNILVRQPCIAPGSLPLFLRMRRLQV